MATHSRRTTSAVWPTTASEPAAPTAPLFANGIGSNGWALGRAATRDHDGMLLANPHVPWTGVEGVVQRGGNGVDVAVDDGSTFIMATELTPQGPQTRTILTYSESANPDSPHYSDQTVLFAHGRWVTERFTQAQISADPRLQTTTIRSGAPGY